MPKLTTEITIKWCYEDVLSIDNTLTPTQISDVLNELKNNHDANIGVNWDVIDTVIDIVKARQAC